MLRFYCGENGKLRARRKDATKLHKDLYPAFL